MNRSSLVALHMEHTFGLFHCIISWVAQWLEFPFFSFQIERDRYMSVAGRAVISYIYTVGRCHPEHERARDGTVSDLTKSIELGGFIVERSVYPLACFLIFQVNRLRRTSVTFVAMQGGCLRIHLTVWPLVHPILYGLPLFRRMGIPGLFGTPVSWRSCPLPSLWAFIFLCSLPRALTCLTSRDKIKRSIEPSSPSLTWPSLLKDVQQ